MPANEPVLERPTRGLDHGAWVPLKAMYPDADIPVLQMSMPDLDPQHLFEIGRRLAPLRDEGVLIVGSGFLTHGLPFIAEYFMGKPGRAAVVDRLRPVGHARRSTAATSTRCSPSASKAPGMPYAHPTVEHFAPLFVTLGAAARPDDAARLRDRGLRLRPLQALVRDPMRVDEPRTRRTFLAQLGKGTGALVNPRPCRVRTGHELELELANLPDCLRAARPDRCVPRSGRRDRSTRSSRIPAARTSRRPSRRARCSGTA